MLQCGEEDTSWEPKFRFWMSNHVSNQVWTLTWYNSSHHLLGLHDAGKPDMTKHRNFQQMTKFCTDCYKQVFCWYLSYLLLLDFIALGPDYMFPSSCANMNCFLPPNVLPLCLSFSVNNQLYLTSFPLVSCKFTRFFSQILVFLRSSRTHSC